MRIRPAELARQLGRSLLPVYLMSGEEPFQLAEASDAIRATARAQGFTARDLFDVGPQFEWHQLVAASQSLSLFGDKRILDLRIPNGKIGKDGSQTLKLYCESPPPDTLLLITLPKLDQKQWNSAWTKAVDKIGGIVQVWPLDNRQLAAWLGHRLTQAGIQATPEVIQVLVERVEGNLSAAAQEVEKLVLLHGNGKIGLEQIEGAVADNARYGVFSLVDAALGGQTAQAIRQLHALCKEGTPAAIVLWALAREVRTLQTVRYAIEQGVNTDTAINAARIWPKRRKLFGNAINRQHPNQIAQLLTLCQKADAAVKGVQQSDPWLILEALILSLCGKPLAIHRN